jgi:hypothetical protein
MEKIKIKSAIEMISWDEIPVVDGTKEFWE